MQLSTGFSTGSSSPAAAMKESPIVLIFCMPCRGRDVLEGLDQLLQVRHNLLRLALVAVAA